MKSLKAITVFFAYAACLSAGMHALLAQSAPAQSPGFTVLYQGFDSGDLGEGPDGPLLLTPSGALIGSTALGGQFGTGTLFSLLPPSSSGGAWTLNTLLSTRSGLFGGVSAMGGNLFSPGGVLSDSGSISELSPVSGADAFLLTDIFDFTDDTTGYEPNQLLTAGGNIFGTALLGGTSNMGTAFELTPPAAGSTMWNEQTIHTFTGPPFESRVPGTLYRISN